MAFRRLNTIELAAFHHATTRAAASARSREPISRRLQSHATSGRRDSGRLPRQTSSGTITRSDYWPLAISRRQIFRRTSARRPNFSPDFGDSSLIRSISSTRPKVPGWLQRTIITSRTILIPRYASDRANARIGATSH